MENRYVVKAIEDKIECLKNEAREVCSYDKEAYDIFYRDEIESLEKSLGLFKEGAITVEESVNKDIFGYEEDEVDEELEMWQLGELNEGYKFGTQSWDI